MDTSLGQLKELVKNSKDCLLNAETVEDIEASAKSMRMIIDRESHKLFTVRIQLSIEAMLIAFDLFAKHRITCVELAERAEDFCAKIDSVLAETEA